MVQAGSCSAQLRATPACLPACPSGPASLRPPPRGLPSRRLSWALVHSQVPGEVQRGIELAEALTDSAGLDQRDLLYLVAVGKYRQRRYIEARRTLKGLMQVLALMACTRWWHVCGLRSCGARACDAVACAAVVAVCAWQGWGCVCVCGRESRRPPPGSGCVKLERAWCREFAAPSRPSARLPACLPACPQVHPEFRQAEGLLEACDREIVKDGLVGVGAGAAILGAVAAIAVAAMRK